MGEFIKVRVKRLLEKVRLFLMLYGFDDNKNKVEVPNKSEQDLVNAKINGLNGKIVNCEVTKAFTHTANKDTVVTVSSPFGAVNDKCFILASRLKVVSSNQLVTYEYGDERDYKLGFDGTSNLKVTCPAMSSTMPASVTLTLKLVGVVLA